jgi:hypothetical protein
MKSRPRHPLLAAALLCAAALPLAPCAHATLYSVGPDQPYTSIGAVPWEALAPGDTVAIHHRAEDYHEKWVICRVGTAQAPIVVRGIPSSTGELPVVNGIDATTRPQLNFWNENRGVIKIGGANNPPDTMPAHIIVENLDIRSGRPPYTFTGRSGLTPYVSNCAAIYIEKGEHVLIRGCTLRDCGNGLFCGHLMTDLVVEGNTILENGIEGSIYEHNNYTEAYGILFQFNHFGPLRADCLGNNLKDRSAGTIIRYNWIESGNRQLDLVDSDYEELYGDPLYRQTFVYGNILIEPDGAGNSQILHYGGDSGSTDQYRKGALYLHNNTIVSTRSGNTTLARLSTMEESCDCRNNVIYTTAPGSRLAILAESGGVIDLRQNWLKPGWVVCHETTPGIVHNYGNVEGSDPGFVDFPTQDFELVGSSACIDAGADLDPAIAGSHTPVLEYVRHALSRPRPADGALDIGAYEFADTGGVLPIGPDPAITGRGFLRAYPNPCAGELHIEIPSGFRPVIVDVAGRPVGGLARAGLHRGPVLPLVPGDPESLELVRYIWSPDAGLPAGTYYLAATGSGGHVYRSVTYLRQR